ncbi:hypothetical protein B0T17DRAFT_459704, partial [Bombardia bombarda]
QEEVTVLITGFGPFNKAFPQNPSWEIACRLPDYLPPLDQRGKPPTTEPEPTPPLLPPVRLLVHPAPIRVNYQTVRALVPQLWDLDGTQHPDRPKVDYVVHIGMAGREHVYAIERRGHRDGYNMRDVDGELLGDEERRTREGKDWIWADEPEELLTDLDLDDVLSRWKSYTPDHIRLKTSDNAGHYLCDFIYFSSLAHLHKAGLRRNVVFMHVPADDSLARIEFGKGTVLRLVRSIVESEMARQGRLKAGDSQ